MRKIVIILVFSISFSVCSTEIEDENSTEEISTVVNNTSTSTTTTIFIQPSEERAKEIDIDRSPRRGVIRTTPARYISTIYKYDSYYSNATVNPVHEWSEEYDYKINYPKLDSNIACSEVIEEEILRVIEIQVEDKKSILEYTNPQIFEEEDVGFWREILHIDYDVIEITEEIVSILFYFYTYSSGAAHGYTEPYSLNYLLYDCSKIDIPIDILDLSTKENQVRVTQEVKLQLCAPEVLVDDCLGRDPFITIEEDELFTSSFRGVFNISSLGLYYQHGPYGASSYAEGMELILLPWNQLQDVLIRTGKYASLLFTLSKLDSYYYTEFEKEWEYKGLSTVHYGLYDYYDFVKDNSYEEGRYFNTYTQTVGLESGEYLYKETWWDAPEYVYDELVQQWCLDDGFTQEECDNTATYQWENPNIFEGIEFQEYSIRCDEELNQKIAEINNSYFERADYYGTPSPRGRGQQWLNYYVPQLFVNGPQDYITILEWGYDDGGGTLRYPYTNPYTMNLDTCEFEDVKDKYVITAERMEQLVLEYVQVGNEINSEGYVVDDYLFDENYLIGDIFFTEDTLYTILWDCFICTDSYLILKDAPENRANPYIVAIPLYEFKKVQGSDNDNSEVALDNFQEAWENSLKPNIELFDAETTLTDELFNKWQWVGDKYNYENQYLYEIQVNGYTCTRIWDSMGYAWIDEIHPIEEDYTISNTYKCDDESEIYLYGQPFYYLDKWWIYQNIEFSWDKVDCKNPCGTYVQNFASRFEIEFPRELLND